MISRAGISPGPKAPPIPANTSPGQRPGNRTQHEIEGQQKLAGDICQYLPGLCDKAGQSTAFIEFMLDAILGALRELDETDQVADQVSDQVAALLRVLDKHTRSALDCMKQLKLTHRPTLRANYLGPALEAGLIERTVPEKPNSRLQKYRLTEKGRARLP